MRIPSELMQAAFQCYREKDFAETEALCAQVLRLDPGYVPALSLLGVTLLGRGATSLALPWLQRAVELSPGASSLCNLGEAYRQAGRISEAVATLARAIELDSRCGEAHCNLGIVEREHGELRRAVSHFERAVVVKPSSAFFQQQLGSALFQAHELDRAEQHLRVAAALDSNLLSARLDLALVFDDRRRYRESLEQYEACLRLEPNHLIALNNLSLALYFLNRLDDSVAVLRRAIDAHPSVSRLHHNLGNSLRALGRLDDAVRAYRTALELDPADERIHSNLIYALPFVEGVSDADVLREARSWEAQHVAHLSRLPLPRRKRARPLRVGYVSANFHEHVQALFMLPLLEAHDRSAFDVYCYSVGTASDAYTEAQRELAHTFRDLTRLSDEQAARIIRDDEIDVLVDLTMHMSGARLGIFARKPAPIQVSWLAYPGTTGLSTIDYRFTDPHIDPLEDPAPGAEASWRLPDTFWCYRPWFRPEEQDTLPGTLPALSRGRITFGCLNNFSKTNARTFRLWARVLSAFSDSRLVLLGSEGSFEENALAVFERTGVSRDRIELVGYSTHEQYLRAYQKIDICLDTLPYSGHTTSLDAWWMGVPVLSLVGDTMVGRAGRCFANNLGLPAWAVETEDAFVEMARQSASDLDALQTLRGGLRERMQACPLMDASRFARNVEAAYLAMWDRYCAPSLDPSVLLSRQDSRTPRQVQA